MPSNYTEHYQLSQWEAADQVKREDFNADNAKIDAALGAIPKIVTGSYRGTGNFGSDHPNKLTFPFPPKVVIIVVNEPSTLDSGTVLIRGQTASSGIGSGYSSSCCLYLTVSWEGDRVSWYTTKKQANLQLNSADTVYFYFAIG